MFHVFTHAFFKALLFLTAGSVMHAMGGVIDLRHFSGLRRTLPTTYKQMLIGCLALAGFPLLSGFWSKDEIIHAAFGRAWWVGAVLLVTAGLTAYYTFRMFFLCFHGERRLPREAGDHPHDMPRVMTWPLWVLAAGAIFAGFLGTTIPAKDPGHAFLGVIQPHGEFHHVLEHSTLISGPMKAGGVWLMYVSAAVALAGIGLAWLRYGQAPQRDPDAAALGGLWRVWHHKYWVDELYDRVFVEPLRALGRVCVGIDRIGIDGVVWSVAGVPRALGAGLRLLQRGVLQAYALGIALGVVGLLLLWQWLARTAVA